MSLVIDLNLILSLGAIFVSSIVAIGTLILALETRRMRESQANPEVFVSFQPHEENIRLIDIVIGNTGKGTAFDVIFKIKPDFEYEKGKYLSELSFINKGIPFLAPNQIIKSTLIRITKDYPFEKVAIPFEIVINYKNTADKKFELIFPMDLNPLENLKRVNGPSIPHNVDRIQNDIRDISKSLERISKK